MQALSNMLARQYWPDTCEKAQVPLIAVRSIPVPGRFDTEYNVIELDLDYLEHHGVLEGMAVTTHELAHWVVNARGITEYHHHGQVWQDVLREAGLDPEVLRFALDDSEIA